MNESMCRFLRQPCLTDTVIVIFVESLFYGHPPKHPEVIFSSLNRSAQRDLHAADGDGGQVVHVHQPVGAVEVALVIAPAQDQIPVLVRVCPAAAPAAGYAAVHHQGAAILAIEDDLLVVDAAVPPVGSISGHPAVVAFQSVALYADPYAKR